jgi:hypothetical protein
MLNFLKSKVLDMLRGLPYFLFMFTTFLLSFSFLSMLIAMWLLCLQLIESGSKEVANLTCDLLKQLKQLIGKEVSHSSSQAI